MSEGFVVESVGLNFRMESMSPESATTVVMLRSCSRRVAIKGSFYRIRLSLASSRFYQFGGNGAGFRAGSMNESRRRRSVKSLPILCLRLSIWDLHRGWMRWTIEGGARLQSGLRASPAACLLFARFFIVCAERGFGLKEDHEPDVPGRICESDCSGPALVPGHTFHWRWQRLRRACIPRAH